MCQWRRQAGRQIQTGIQQACWQDRQTCPLAGPVSQHAAAQLPVKQQRPSKTSHAPEAAAGGGWRALAVGVALHRLRAGAGLGAWGRRGGLGSGLGAWWGCGWVGVGLQGVAGLLGDTTQARLQGDKRTHSRAEKRGQKREAAAAGREGSGAGHTAVRTIACPMSALCQLRAHSHNHALTVLVVSDPWSMNCQVGAAGQQRAVHPLKQPTPRTLPRPMRILM
jgi:hypothetical protein